MLCKICNVKKNCGFGNLKIYLVEKIKKVFLFDYLFENNFVN